MEAVFGQQAVSETAANRCIRTLRPIWTQLFFCFGDVSKMFQVKR
jgi:hypothetical protein